MTKSEAIAILKKKLARRIELNDPAHWKPRGQIGPVKTITLSFREAEEMILALESETSRL